MSNETDPRLEEITTKSLPLSEREENPPLVVDLPDGQKLVVGDIKAGTVIEVATWRGTGRPDSRTHRFMLGISHDEPEALIRPTRSEPEVQVEKNFETTPDVIEIPQVIDVPQVTDVPVVIDIPEVAEVSQVADEPEATVEVAEPEVPEVVEIIEANTEPEEAVAENEASDFIQGERLSSRTDLLFGASTQYIDKGVAYFPPANPTKQLVAPVSNVDFKKTFKVLRPILFSAIGVIAALAVLIALNISIAHPRSGLDTALGNAKSTLMIVQGKENYAVGESVVGDSPAQPENPVFGVIAAVGEGVYMLNGDLGYISVGQDDVHGKVLAIAPWWGKLADLIGL
jgi:hypothetical protein